MRDLDGNIYRPNLYAGLAVPSAVHWHSLTVEYMKKWYLEKFDKNFFKTVFVNGKHVFADYKRFNSAELLMRKEKPMLAMTPVIDFDFDNDTLDIYQFDMKTLINRTDYTKSFFQDKEKNIYLGHKSKLYQMNVNFKSRVSSRAKQIDLINYMYLAFRVGATETDYIAVDYHIPYDIMMMIAKMAGFTISKGQVENIHEFLRYLNSHSTMPIVFKLRAITGNYEFFFRDPEVMVHIRHTDKIEYDDGEREGVLEANFHVELNCQVMMPSPQFYCLYSTSKIAGDVKTQDTSDFGMFTIKLLDIPEENNMGWKQYIITGYEYDWLYGDGQEHYLDIPIKELFEPSILDIIDDCIKQNLSPLLFMEIKIYNGDTEIPIKYDWTTLSINSDQRIYYPTSTISVYVDKEYVNERLITIDNIKKTRIK